jgi:hypothetical protein
MDGYAFVCSAPSAYIASSNNAHLPARFKDCSARRIHFSRGVVEMANLNSFNLVGLTVFAAQMVIGLAVIAF